MIQYKKNNFSLSIFSDKLKLNDPPQLTKRIKKGGLTHQTLPDINKYAPFRYNYVTTII